jgi:hypothetical protein
VNHYTGQIIEIQLEAYKNASALIRIPTKAMPRPGQYLHANQIGNNEEALPTSLFLSGLEASPSQGEENNILVWGDLPTDWTVGTSLALRGPLGQPFTLPKNLKRLALISLDSNVGRLLPLIPLAQAQNTEIALFTEQRVIDLPYEVELRLLNAILEAKDWADFLAIDCPASQIEHLSQTLGLDPDFPNKIKGEVLLTKDMPCGGLAKCGVCSLKLSRKEILLCELGPVVSLSMLIF